MVYRVYVEKKTGFDNESASLKNDIISFLNVKSLKDVRIIKRYDVEDIKPELFENSVSTVFSEPQTDNVYPEPETDGAYVFAVEYLPGQYDMRADSAAQCIQIISGGERPEVKTAKLYALYGDLSDGDIKKIKKHVINPVEAREAALDKPETLKINHPVPESVKVLDGFTKMKDDEAQAFIDEYSLAMDADDLRFCRDYFVSEHRDPTITEIRMIDTYWSDHCRHTTFLTKIDGVTFDDAEIENTYKDYLKTREYLGRTKPVTLMDIATVAVKYLKKEGKLDKLDESEEINACTVKIDVNADGKTEKWLLLFKNETHNHPTEIEPFGGAATCIGGAIRDPLSGRAYVYGAIRVTGAADPCAPVEKTLVGKLPQRKLVTTAAAGYSSYGNQIGLATGIVDEIYHPGYAAKHMEIGAVIAATPEDHVRREVPLPGDSVILLGGRTGRDGCGGATGSSKAHNVKSIEKCGAEVQKGNAPEERKLQRLFRNAEASRLIKRCNDFGAGGVSVAVGELADGLLIDLDRVPKKYDGLDGTELAISESQERMAVVVSQDDVKRFLSLAESENIEATVIASVTDSERLVMTWNGKNIVDISREFLNSNGADKHIMIHAASGKSFEKKTERSFTDEYISLAGKLNVCSKQGLSERFDSTIGAGSVMMPFGGKYQLTPVQSMVQKISREKGDTDTCSLMSYGYNPEISEKSPYHGAYLAVTESVSKLIATGAEFKDVYLTFQEYFEKPFADSERWGKPLSALLGAFRAQKELGIAAIGGKDSMSGSFENIDVPPTLVSFAVTTSGLDDIITPEMKPINSPVILIKPEYDEHGIPLAASQLEVYKKVTALMRSGIVLAAYTPTCGGIAEAVMKMCLGNKTGFTYSENIGKDEIFGYAYGSFILQVKDARGCRVLGQVCSGSDVISYKNEKISLGDLIKTYEERLEGVYPRKVFGENKKAGKYSYVSSGRYAYNGEKFAKPTVLIPVFPGTNCEYDSVKAVERAGGVAETFVVSNITPELVGRSATAFAEKLKNSQMIFIPGGFSGGDEPDGSGKFITAFFRNSYVREEVNGLIERRDGLICGICNGFQALIKLGLVPFGRITDADASAPTLTYNTIGRHQSRIVYTRIASDKSPWLSKVKIGDVYAVPISHGEGRFIADGGLIKKLADNGQIATQYVDFDGNPTYDIAFNPNGSFDAIEGITSPNGRIFGKMGHSERYSSGIYRNIPGDFDMKMFEGAVEYFK